MKILSRPEGDGLLTNTEVRVWLKEKNFEADKRDLPETAVRPPSSTVTLARDLRMYLESSPSCNETVDSVRALFDRLAKFKLSAPELMMIANIRPEGYAHLTPLIVDIYSRFDDDQVYEILEIINSTLERRKKGDGQDDNSKQKRPLEAGETAAHEDEAGVASAMADYTSMAEALPLSGSQNMITGTDPNLSSVARDATMTDNGTVAAQTAQTETTGLLPATDEREFADAAASGYRDATILDISQLPPSATSGDPLASQAPAVPVKMTTGLTATATEPATVPTRAPEETKLIFQAGTSVVEAATDAPSELKVSALAQVGTAVPGDTMTAMPVDERTDVQTDAISTAATDPSAVAVTDTTAGAPREATVLDISERWVPKSE